MAIVGSSSQSSIADDFLHLASETIRNHEASEGAFRTAISRVYYAVFLTVRDQLFGPDGARLTARIRKQLDTEFRRTHKANPGSHDLIIFAITKARSSATLRPIVLSQQVDQLKEARTHADYHFTQGNLTSILENSWQEYARKSVELASQLLAMARKLPSY